MFFNGVLQVLRAHGESTTNVFSTLEIEAPRLPFGLYPHQGFYKLCFWAASLAYPKLPMGEAMYTLAASFFPIFKQSIVGRTMAPLMGTRPLQILSRLIDAYRLCVPRNVHELKAVSNVRAEWHCEVEPGDYYPVIFRGIVTGAMLAQGVPMPVVELSHHSALGYGQSCTFAISWRD